MNIFATSCDPVECALALDDLRVSKMVLETAQILSTAINKYGAYNDRLYKSYNPGMDLNLWAAYSRGNFAWLVEHGTALAHLHTQINKKVHKSASVIYAASAMRHVIPLGERTRFCNHAKNNRHRLDFTVEPVLVAYKKYLSARWQTDKLKPKWTGREEPEWRAEYG